VLVDKNFSSFVCGEEVVSGLGRASVSVLEEEEEESMNKGH
jgi:hypothetical protein